MKDIETAINFVDDLKKIVDKYTKRGLTYIEFIGGLEMLKLELFSENKVIDSQNIEWN